MNKTLAPKKLRNVAGDVYMELVGRFPLRPIRSDAEYHKASAVMMSLAMKGEKRLSSGERDYLDAITVFVGRYDDEHYPLAGKCTPLECLKYLMEENGMKAIDLGELVGGRGQASLILHGRRDLSKANIRALATRFKVSPALFL
ncbi:MAG: type II toxin-antitoxin system HigA family antitoxin [Tepidisphaerales bacterium]